MERVPMTAIGETQLREELKNLKSVERHRIIKAIEEARAHGDLKENAEYHAAKEQQSFVEGRIQEVEGKLSRIQVINVATMENNGKVIFGATVTLMNLETEAVVTYQIVGEDEADIKKSKLSYRSPIARAIIGRHEGDEVQVQTPGGVVEYEITNVEYV
jgi:transcription elongation factor GreA